MKRLLFTVYIIVSAIIGLSVVSSCDKEKKQEEPIDIYMMDDCTWVVTESDTKTEDSIFINGDEGDFTVGGYADATSGSDASIIDIWWDCSRCNFTGDIRPKENNKITFIAGNIHYSGNIRTIRTNEEYVITKLDKFEMVLKRIAPSNNTGKVIFKRK